MCLNNIMLLSQCCPTILTNLLNTQILFPGNMKQWVTRGTWEKLRWKQNFKLIHQIKQNQTKILTLIHTSKVLEKKKKFALACTVVKKLLTVKASASIASTEDRYREPSLQTNYYSLIRCKCSHVAAPSGVQMLLMRCIEVAHDCSLVTSRSADLVMSSSLQAHVYNCYNSILRQVDEQTASVMMKGWCTMEW